MWPNLKSTLKMCKSLRYAGSGENIATLIYRSRNYNGPACHFSSFANVKHSVNFEVRTFWLFKIIQVMKVTAWPIR